LGAPAEAPPVLHPPARPVVLIGLVGADLRPELLVQAPLGFLQTLRAAPRNRLRIRGPLGPEAPLGFTQPPAPTLSSRELRRQFVAARVAVKLVFGGIDRLDFLEDLARELLVVAVLVARRVRRDLRPVDRDHTDLGQAAAGAKRQDLAEQAGNRVLVALDEPRDRRVIGLLLRRQHAERNVLLARPLDLPRRACPARERVEQQRHHHRRVISRPATTIEAIDRIERLQLHLRDGVDDKPRQMVLRQPLPDIGRHQKRLITITRDEALSHHQMVLNPPDSTPDLRDSLASTR